MPPIIWLSAEGDKPAEIVGVQAGTTFPSHGHLITVDSDQSDEDRISMGKMLKSDFLFARPSFVSGVGRTVDLFGTFDDYNCSNTPEEADAAALASDWGIVGQDIYAAMDDLDEEIEEVA